MTDSQLAGKVDAVLEEHPALNVYGFGLHTEDMRTLSLEEQAKKLQENREELRGALPEIRHVLAWLADVEPIKAFNRNQTSYGLKHRAEESALYGYVSNGAFIVGAIIAGFNVKRATPNAFFNMSQKSLNQKASGNSR